MIVTVGSKNRSYRRSGSCFLCQPPVQERQILPRKRHDEETPSKQQLSTVDDFRKLDGSTDEDCLFLSLFSFLLSLSLFTFLSISCLRRRLPACFVRWFEAGTRSNVDAATITRSKEKTLSSDRLTADERNEVKNGSVKNACRTENYRETK